MKSTAHTAPVSTAPTGAELISTERQRQITEEGWSAASDDEHTCGELALAGAAYALTGIEDIAERPLRAEIRRLFPWSLDWLKPRNPVRDLTRAGALIAAELDRLLRTDPQAARGSAYRG
jgi:hypothetical protein